MEGHVISVDEQDNAIGLVSKMEAREKAVLHRASSVFVFNQKGEIMLQQRAADEYRSPMLWTNTCCSHPREGETTVEAGKHQLQEEMGFSTELIDVMSFIYKAPFNNELTEHELDHILIEYYEGSPIINPEGVAARRRALPEDIRKDTATHPEKYTEWSKIISEEYEEKLDN